MKRRPLLFFMKNGKSPLCCKLIKRCGAPVRFPKTMRFFLVGLCAIGIFSVGASSATIRPNIGSTKNNDDGYLQSAMFFPTRNGRHRTFRRPPDKVQETPRRTSLNANTDNASKRIRIPITTYRNRDFTTPKTINNFRQTPHFPGPRNEHQDTTAPPGGRMSSKRITESMMTNVRSLPQTSRFFPNSQYFGLPQTLAQFNDKRNFASRSLFRQPLGEGSLLGIIPLGSPPIDPHNIPSFLPRPLEEDFEDYEMFSFPVPLFRRPFLSHRPHPIVTDRLASIGFSLPSPIRLYQSLQVNDGGNALSALQTPLVFGAKGSNRRILDLGGLREVQVTKDGHGHTPFFREQPLRRPLENSRSLQINPDRPHSRFSVELIRGATQSDNQFNEKQLGKRFKTPSYVTGIPPHNHPLLERFDMGPFFGNLN